MGPKQEYLANSTAFTIEPEIEFIALKQWKTKFAHLWDSVS